MDLAGFRAALATADAGPPREALAFARANWEEARPALLAMLTACAKPDEPSEREANAAFFAIHLLAEKREERAFPVLCALAKNPGVTEAILGDIDLDYYHRLLLNVCQDRDAFARQAADPACDEGCRVAFLRAWRWVALTNGLPVEDAWRFLLELRDAPVEEPLELFAIEWAEALIGFDPDRARPLIVEAFAGDGLPDDLDMREFDPLIEAARADPQGERETWLVENAPIADPIGYFERWLERAQEAGGPEGDEDDEALAPVSNPYRDVGRNDPCPCGSGKKFKKCCLPAFEAGQRP